MSRVLIIAQSEFLTLVKTKAFIIGILLMPILMVAFFFFMSYAERQIDTERRPFAVLDHTGVLFDAVQAAATERNAGYVVDGERTGPEFLPERTDVRSDVNAYLLNALSYLVNNQVIGQEVPQLVAEIQTSLQERGLEIPDQPNPQFERPLTSSSQRSG